MLCVDICGNVRANLLDANVFRYLLMVAASGKLKALIGGPPCRTVSALRYQDDGGPREVRSELWPYGLPNQSPAERELVVSDSVLFFRFLLLYVVAEDVRSSEDEITTFLCEQPQDPKEYRSAHDVEKFKYMSMWRTSEWKVFAERFGIHMVSFEQGAMGHCKRKPTTIGTTLGAMLELDGMCSDRSIEPLSSGDRTDKSLQQRCDESKTWSAWAPGLKASIVHCLKQQQQLWDRQTTSPDNPLIRPLGPVALEQWKRHYANDHLPARRDCKHCLRAAGRSRPHRRVKHADAFTLSVDLSGRLTKGEDQSGKSAKYIMVAVYTFPVTGSGEPLLSPPGQSQEEDDHPLPPPKAEVQDEMDPAPSADDLGHEASGAPEEDADFLGEGVQPFNGDGAPLPDEVCDDDPAPDQPSAAETKAEACAKSAFDTWHRLVVETTDVGVSNLTFIETLPSRNARDVLPALARIHCRLRALGLPLLRLHTDRARELIAAPIRQWTMARGILPTMTSGDSYKGNGRAESEVNATKKAIRAVMDLGACDLKFWPLIARHVGERRLRHQLSKVGWPVAPLLRFGTKTFAIRKRWKERYQDWRRVREEVMIMGPDIYASMTTPSYYVQSLEDNKFFFTDDVVAPEHEAPADALEDQVLYLTERGELPAPVAWDNEPRRRINGKQSVPMLSMSHLEGEKVATTRFPMLFEPTEGIPAAKAQSGRRPPALQLFDATAVEYDGQSSDSWTLGTPSGSSLEEETEIGGGDMEEAPNSWCGGSSPAASHSWFPSPKCPACSLKPLCAEAVKDENEDPKITSLRLMQANLSQHVRDEMELLDATSGNQHLWIPILTEAMLQKIQIEENLLDYQHEQEQVTKQSLEEEFLVTRTIGSKEVWDHLDDWEASIRAEHNQLVTSKEAVIQISRSELDKMAEEKQLPIELLPAKMVHTRKANSGAYRSKAVICGNFAKDDANTCKYAGGADAVQARALVRTASQQDWSVAASDIRVAFLNAPRRDHTKLVACEVPSVFKRLGLANSDSIWLVSKALYGLTTSPRDWGIHRDQTVPKIGWNRTDKDGKVWKGRFVHSGDDNMWRLIETCEDSEVSNWVGLLAVYVDDLLIAAPTEVIQSAMEALSQTWAISEVEYATADHALRFCGFEIQADENQDGFHLHQRMYEKELMSRWPVEGSLHVPVFKVTEDDEGVKEFSPDELASAQALTGALLWLSTRTRPELMHGVATMSRLLSRNPKKAVEIGYVLLQFIKGCPGGLHYPKEPPSGLWGSRQQLKVPRHSKLVEVYADIAYGAGANFRSVQGIIIYFGGVPIAWQSNQQPFVTHSTAEAELVSYCEALQAGKATETMLCMMFGQTMDQNDFERVIYGDNLASIGLAHGNTAASWRTRHLRIRANVMKEALEGGDSFPGGVWKLLHLKGTELVADGLTKPLNGQAFERFLQDLGVSRPTRSTTTGSRGVGETGPQGSTAAVMALVVGSSLLAQAEAVEDDEIEAISLDWIGGLCLMLMGAIYTGQLVHSLGHCCLRRLRSASTSSTAQVRSTCEKRPEEEEWDVVSQDEAEGSDGRRAVGNPTSKSMPRPSGFSTAASGTPSSFQSMPRQSGSCIAAQASSSRDVTIAADVPLQRSATNAAAVPLQRSAANAAASSSEQSESSERVQAPVQAPRQRWIKNPWNQFQHEHKNRGWSTSKMLREYNKWKTNQ